MDKQEKLRKLLLLFSISRVLIEKVFAIIEMVNSYEEFLNSKAEMIKILGINKYNKVIENNEFIEKNVIEMNKKGVKYIIYNEAKYPQQLREIFDPPFILFYVGDILLLNEFSLGIVGSRKPTAYGIYAANHFAKELVKKGVVVVSGMAKGIDSESHIATLESKGKTIAVLGGPLDDVYPKNNIKLYNNIIEQKGVVISEFPLGETTLPFQFVQRNRIISGLSRGVLVIEAGEKSGTLTTVDFGLDQGRNIYALPGNINSLNSKGTNRLLKEGAKLVTEIQDILEDYPFVQFSDKSEIKKRLSKEELAIMGVLNSFGPQNIEKIAFFTKIGIKDIIGILSVLEIKGYVKEIENNLYIPT